MTTTPVKRILSALESATGRPAQRNGKGWTARCPAHDDRNPSLSIAEGDDGRALVNCHANQGCTADAICAAIGLTLSDLMPETNGRDKGTVARGSQQGTKRPRTFATAADAVAQLERQHGPRSAAWTYHDAGGEPVGMIVRWDKASGKDIRPVARRGDGWIIGGMPDPKPLYDLPGLAGAEVVCVVEGEKAADAARTIGLTATTSPHGSKSAGKADWTPLAGKRVVILPDNDAAGRSYAEAVAEILAKLTPPAIVKTVDLLDLPEGGDMVDWIDAHGDAAESDDLRRQVEALAEAAEVIQRTDGETGQSTAPVIVRLADVHPEAVRWLWPGRIARGKLTLLAGDPGLGKSFVSLDLAARVSVGSPWPDDPSTRAPQGSVVLLSAEDDLGDTIRPRLDAAGADVKRIHALTTVTVKDDKGEYSRPVDLTRDLEHVEAAIKQAGDCKLVVIDPISAYLGGTDSHKNAEVRGMLTPLAELAAKHDVALLAITHLRKSAGPAVYRSMGSLAFTAAARAVWVVTKDNEDEQRRLVLPVKNNIAPDVNGLAYRIEPYGDGGAAVVVWEADTVTISADEALASERGGDDGETSALAEAIDWLRHTLADGPHPGNEVKSEAKLDGIALRTLDRAKAKLGVKAAPEGLRGPWVWRLPEVDAEAQSAPDSPECATQETVAHSGNVGALCNDSQAPDDESEVTEWTA